MHDNADTRARAFQIIAALRSDLAQIHNSARIGQDVDHVQALVDNMHLFDQWCVSWNSEELRQAVHVPLAANEVYNAIGNTQRIAGLVGAQVVPIETGLAILGLPPTTADAVLRYCAREGSRLHQPRTLQTYDTHLATSADIRLSAPAAGHDLTWMVATGGQIHPSEVARALFWILGEQPTA